LQRNLNQAARPSAEELLRDLYRLHDATVTEGRSDHQHVTAELVNSLVVWLRIRHADQQQEIFLVHLGKERDILEVCEGRKVDWHSI
jgi:hypothetical protein